MSRDSIYLRPKQVPHSGWGNWPSDMASVIGWIKKKRNLIIANSCKQYSILSIQVCEVFRYISLSKF